MVELRMMGRYNNREKESISEKENNSSISLSRKKCCQGES